MKTVFLMIAMLAFSSLALAQRPPAYGNPKSTPKNTSDSMRDQALSELWAPEPEVKPKSQKIPAGKKSGNSSPKTQEPTPSQKE